MTGEFKHWRQIRFYFIAVAPILSHLNRQ